MPADFTTDVTTDVGKIRLLIGDVDSTDIQMTDTQITALFTLYNQDLFPTCAACCESMAARVAATFNQVKIGSLDLNDKDKYAALKNQADRFRKIDEELPAFAIAEQGYSDFNYLTMVRNFILRTE